MTIAGLWRAWFRPRSEEPPRDPQWWPEPGQERPVQEPWEADAARWQPPY